LNEHKTVGMRLAEARKEAGYTQAQLAEAVGMGTNTIALYELDRVQPTFGRIVKIAELLDISLDWLAMGVSE